MLFKPLAVIKNDMKNDEHLSLPKLGWLDVAMLLPLAIVQIFYSSYGDRAEPRYVLTLSLSIASSLILFFVKSLFLAEYFNL